MTSLLTVDVHVAPDARRTALEADVRAGLVADTKTLPPIWFYDERGSQLFDEITRLPEYYLTRAERSILDAHAEDIVAASRASTLVELGSGTSEKTRLLLDTMAASGRLRRFVPFDVSEETLRRAAADITAAYGCEVCAVVGDFHRHLAEIPQDGRRLVAFLGSTIGNLTPPERRRFLTDLDATMMFDDRLLLGTDLLKDRRRLLAAYDDAAGVTADFNRNVLRVLNVELGAHFDPDAFDHVARWDEEHRWIEMRLRSRGRQIIAIDELDLHVAFEDGEELRTEISAKFTPAQVEKELWDGGFVVESTWTDPAGDFLLTLARPYC
jgi:L-histidine N-alpha-methyltransferase